MKFNNETIRKAVKEWCEDQESALKKYGDINEWDTSEVTDMSKLFDCKFKFNSPIGNWNVSKVTNMKDIFYFAEKFNQSLNNWDVSNVTDMSYMFDDAISFNQTLDNWDVSNVTDMSGMFNNASSFNQPLNNWDVSNVTDMSYMFRGAESFNQPLDNWDVSNVTDMSYMFGRAKSFNQPLDNWDVSNVNEDGTPAREVTSSFKQKFSKNKSELKIDELKASKTQIDTKDFLIKNTQIKINNQFSLKNSDNKFKLIDYTWNGGDDFNYNIFNKEPLPEGEYIGSPSSSELTISVNDTTLYIKHYDIQDGPISEGYYLGISQSPNYDNIEWFNYKFGIGDNPELINIIFILCIGLRDEDFVYEHGEFDYYEEPGHKYQVNTEIDINALKDMWDEF